MIDINKEAEEYAKNNTEVPGYQVIFKHCFIAGANSKATQAKILQAKITLCEDVIFFKENENETSDCLEILLKRFKQQLKQLEE
jgi:hypothetical protein